MIRVQEADFEVGTELAGFAANDLSVGGVCSFVGLVRGEAGDVAAMTLEHYPGMTERQLAAIEAEARQRWRLADLLVIHRVGRLAAGDRIVLVATAAAHREDAFDACQFLIDWLKTKAPFWKREDRANGPGAWVDAREEDNAAASRWT